MYGLINCVLENMVRSDYGDAAWNAILSETYPDDKVERFLVHKVYGDESFFRLLDATCKILDTNRDETIEAVGVNFYKYLNDNGYDRVMRCMSRDLIGFLRGLNDLHHHLESVYPGMIAPSFRVAFSTTGEVLLHYYSTRPFLGPMVSAMVKCVANIFYSMNIKMDAKYCDFENGKFHTVFLINTFCKNQKEFCSEQITDVISTTHNSNVTLDLRSIWEIVPFHVFFDRSMKIMQLGRSLQKIVKKYLPLNKGNFSDIFHILMPVVSPTFHSISINSDSIFVTKTELSSTLILKLKGQMLFDQATNCMLFVCSPRPVDISDMLSMGINIDDFSPSDVTRDLIFNRHIALVKRDLTKWLEETSDRLIEMQKRLSEDKHITEELLSMILPMKVVEKLKLKLPIDADTHDIVTILFSDIVGFTNMCSQENVQPMDVIRMLNKLFTKFDLFSSQNKLHKIETIGDGYMAASGLTNNPRHDHGDRALMSAYKMMECICDVNCPGTDSSIQLRIGVHSGPCISGIVGQKMPRYCLFGNTVTTASQVEQFSKPGKINISVDTKNALLKPDDHVFTDNNTCPSGMVKCYFVQRSEASTSYTRQDFDFTINSESSLQTELSTESLFCEASATQCGGDVNNTKTIASSKITTLQRVNKLDLKEPIAVNTCITRSRQRRIASVDVPLERQHYHYTTFKRSLSVDGIKDDKQYCHGEDFWINPDVPSFLFDDSGNDSESEYNVLAFL